MINPEKREITKELSESYLDYAMSVIIARALPDVRDGMKPVQRRILWDMWESGLTHASKFRKSATVVGDTMAKYHPHGNDAIYDTMVRMAQDFSLRYPLVHGQGNFGCFTKDTKVKLTDGRKVSFGDLVAEHAVGKKNYTYTVNKLGLISIAEIKNPRLTRKDAALVRVTLDNGEEIRCTPDHRFMLRSGAYCEAKDLQPGDSLMPLYEKLSEKTDRLQREGYLLVRQNKTGEWIPAHHLADNYNLTNGKYKTSAGRVRHHIDFNKSNNDPDNIARLHWGEHWKIHYEQASRQHENPEYRKKIAAGRNEYWARPESKERQAQRMTLRNVTNWSDAEYREKMRRMLSDVNKAYIAAHPEKRKESSERLTATLQRMWKDPDYQARMHEKIVKANQNRVTNKTGKLKFLNICRAAFEQFGVIDADGYKNARNERYPYGSAPHWETGIQKYFSNDIQRVKAEASNNHKVVSVKALSEQEDVYDITVEGTHNFALAAGIFVHNSIDGDPPAAFRYTEAKLARITDEVLEDIEKETVDWVPNYDATRNEPLVLPAQPAKPAFERRLGHRGRHGDEHPDAQPERDRGCDPVSCRTRGRDDRGPFAVREGAGLPDGRHHLRCEGDQGGVRERPRRRSLRARRRRSWKTRRASNLISW